MAHDTLYDTDVLEWSEQQAAALRDLARARRDLPNELDIENIAEEIESVGRSEFATAKSLLRQILIHLIKAVSLPEAPALAHWRLEAMAFRTDLKDRLSPSMLRRIDLEGIWREAIRQAELALAAHGDMIHAALRDSCPVSLDEMLDDDFDLLRLAERIGRSLLAGL